MRRPWIKIETCTPDKPEICSLATQLKMDEDTVVGKLVRLWSWAELNRIYPNDIGVTKEFIDKLVGRKGFAAALAQTGWLMETDGKLSFRNFKRHNSPVAQNKALTAKRVARHRLRKSATQEQETVAPLPEAAPEAFKKGKKRKPVAIENATGESFHEPINESPSVNETSDFVDAVKDVVMTDSSLVFNEKVTSNTTPYSVDSVTLPVDSPNIVEEGETMPQITPEEALAALQAEEPAPRKRRSKAAADTDDQPMLF